ncbi:DUF423 domain-containing protein [Gramella sp. GC03-9]|uniref:DUF423 domain-containing protein n=1 Tax=Christiangramia oceanisediminis TaxID=2920386 RepID=A0A9X2KX98_9FLAO|nr:DUF423 domain-containing protein [Gramella oceanisediminis]MCP9198751.1 DUF423 domain-containing protein [Gramella oceanisediminis]
MNRRFIVAGAFFGLTAVLLGAFGAHGLKESLSESSLASFETGIRFQMYHSFLLLILGVLKLNSSKTHNWLFYLICLGVVLFSGSIYLLSTADITGIELGKFALVTPVGGSLLIIAWSILLLSFIKLKKK